MNKCKFVVRVDEATSSRVREKAKEFSASINSVLISAIDMGLDKIDEEGPQFRPTSSDSRVLLDSAHDFYWWLIVIKGWSRRSASTGASLVRNAISNCATAEELFNYHSDPKHKQSSAYSLKSILGYWGEWCSDTENDPLTLEN